MKAFLIILPSTAELIRSNTKFQTLKTLEPVPPKLKRSHRPLWMSPDSIRLIDKRVALRRNPFHSRILARGVAIAVRCSLVEARRRAGEAATEIGACLEPYMGGTDPTERTPY